MKRVSISSIMLVVSVAVIGCGGSRTELVMDPVPPPQPAVQPRDNGDAERARREAEEARAREEEAKRRAAERARATLAELIHFDYDQATIRADAQPILDRKLEVLRSNPEYRIRIEGHCDERGSDEYNMALGMRRASAVRKYLTDRGIAASRLDAISLGEERPLERLKNERSWSRNRRAEFHIVAPLAAIP